VQLASHLVRLTPRWQGVQSHSQVLNVLLAPAAPVARFEQSDAYGNATIRLEFSGTTQLLDIESRLEVQTLLPAPLAPHCAPWPWPLTATSGSDASVAKFARGLVAQAGQQVVPFLDLLAHTLYTRTRQMTRTEGAAQPAALTLAAAEGSCRDLAALFVAACSSLGMTSRFASGYLAPADTLDLPRQMHAWAEVWLPDRATGQGRFFGWDPALGRRVADKHVCLCVAPEPSATLPIEGGYSFIGSQLTTTLDYDIRMRVSP
jgi:transglutaminase-like putative cysteine protease